MHHTGELFIRTPEADHPLQIRLKLITGKHHNSETITALEHELEQAILWFFDLRFRELVDFEYAPEQSVFALNLIRNETLNTILRMIKNDITDELLDKNIVGFEFTNLTGLSE
jgi:hypothetical protein